MDNKSITIEVPLTKEDCYKDLFSFYKTVLEKTGILFRPNTRFDCRYICISKPVQDQIIAYYKEIQHANDTQVGILLACNGPKANIEAHDSESEYVAIINSEFVSVYNKEEELDS